MSTEASEFIEDLDGGVFADKVSRILGEVAGAVMDHQKKGLVVINLAITPGGGSQVMVSHDIAYKRPTTRGMASENDTTTTPMHVGKGGKMSFFPENQTKLFSNED